MKYKKRRRCPKCGHRKIADRYRNMMVGLKDKIRRECENCRHVWDEEPLDSNDRKDEG